MKTGRGRWRCLNWIVFVSPPNAGVFLTTRKFIRKYRESAVPSGSAHDCARAATLKSLVSRETLQPACILNLSRRR